MTHVQYLNYLLAYIFTYLFSYLSHQTQRCRTSSMRICVLTRSRHLFGFLKVAITIESCWKITFCISYCGAATDYKPCGQVYNFPASRIFSGCRIPKIVKIGWFFSAEFFKNKRGRFLRPVAYATAELSNRRHSTLACCIWWNPQILLFYELKRTRVEIIPMYTQVSPSCDCEMPF